MAGPAANTIAPQSQSGIFGRDLIADDHVLVGFLKVNSEQRIFNFIVEYPVSRRTNQDTGIHPIMAIA